MFILEILLPVFSVIAVGALYGRFHRPDMDAANRVNLDVFVPALILDVLVSRDFRIAEYLSLAGGVVLVVLGSGALSYLVIRLAGHHVRSILPPMMFSNAGNLGLPLMLATFGEPGLPAAVVLFIVENLLHFTLGFSIVSGQINLAALARNPIVLAAAGGFAFNLVDGVSTQFVLMPLHLLGQISVPLMLFSLGVRLLDVNFGDWRMGLYGMVLCPLSGLLVAFVALQIINVPPEQRTMLLLFSLLPPAVLNFILAEKFGQDPATVASIVLQGNVASTVILPLALWAFL